MNNPLLSKEFDNQSDQEARVVCECGYAAYVPPRSVHAHVHYDDTEPKLHDFDKPWKNEAKELESNSMNGLLELMEAVIDSDWTNEEVLELAIAIREGRTIITEKKDFRPEDKADTRPRYYPESYKPSWGRTPITDEWMKKLEELSQTNTPPITINIDSTNSPPDWINNTI